MEFQWMICQHLNAKHQSYLTIDPVSDKAFDVDHLSLLEIWDIHSENMEDQFEDPRYDFTTYPKNK